jgi:hypothetical protein
MTTSLRAIQDALEKHESPKILAEHARIIEWIEQYTTEDKIDRRISKQHQDDFW